MELELDCLLDSSRRRCMIMVGKAATKSRTWHRSRPSELLTICSFLASHIASCFRRVSGLLAANLDELSARDGADYSHGTRCAEAEHVPPHTDPALSNDAKVWCGYAWRLPAACPKLLTCDAPVQGPLRAIPNGRAVPGTERGYSWRQNAFLLGGFTEPT